MKNYLKWIKRVWFGGVESVVLWILFILPAFQRSWTVAICIAASMFFLVPLLAMCDYQLKKLRKQRLDK